MHGLVAAGISIALGSLIALQAPLNAMLGRSLGSPVSAALASLLVSAVCAVGLYGVAGGGAEWRAPPVWLYLGGGLLGATFVIGSLLLVPRLGSAGFLAAVVLGQMVAGLVMDHVGAFGLELHPATLGRVAGVALVAAGVLLLRLA